MAERIVTGMRELDRVLLHLERKAANRVARAANSAGLTVLARAIRVELRSRFQKRTGRLFRSVGRRNKKNRRKGLHEAKAGPSVGRGNARLAPHAHLATIGTRDRFTGQKTIRRGGKRFVFGTGKTRGYRGRVKRSLAVPVAAAKSRAQAAKAMTEKAWQRLKAEVRKARRS